jgi:hypothetical protein
MPAQTESPAVVSGTSNKTLRLLRKRLRQLLRVTLVLVICLVVAAGAFAIWWLTSLNGLPDIGDPFDVAEFRAFSIPDDQNAFAFLRRASQMLTPGPLTSPSVPWSRADPKLREWVESNREALELYQQGAEQSDAAQLAGDHTDVRYLMGLALVEGSKRQESGDTAGAWECYRAVLRMTAHVLRRGSLAQRKDLIRGIRFYQQQQRLAEWAADPRTTIPQLHGALEEVLKSEPRPEWDSFLIRASYLEIMSFMEQPVHPFVQEDVGWEYTYRLDDMQLSEDMVGHLDAAHRLLLREPERSRRVLRLLCANWLAHVETPQLRQRKPAVWVSFPLRLSTNPIRDGTTRVPLYPVSPAVPAGARSLPPQELASWLVTTNDAKLRILVMNSYMPWSPANHLRDRKAHRELVIMLATEIYHRERGSLPPSEEALVGTYLKSLPDDGSADLADEKTPTVE